MGGRWKTKFCETHLLCSGVVDEWFRSNPTFYSLALYGYSGGVTRTGCQSCIQSWFFVGAIHYTCNMRVSVFYCCLFLFFVSNRSAHVGTYGAPPSAWHSAQLKRACNSIMRVEIAAAVMNVSSCSTGSVKTEGLDERAKLLHTTCIVSFSHGLHGGSSALVRLLFASVCDNL